MELNDRMRNYLRLAAEDETLSFSGIVESGLLLYINETGPLRISTEEEFAPLFQECIKFVLDETLTKLVLMGVIEVSSLDENNEFLYGLVVPKP